MVKRPQKSLIKPNNTLLEYKPTPKSRQQINQENYQKNKKKLKAQQKENYLKKKQREQEQSTKYYQATNIKILLTLKQYTELNQQN